MTFGEIADYVMKHGSGPQALSKARLMRYLEAWYRRIWARENWLPALESVAQEVTPPGAATSADAPFTWGVVAIDSTTLETVTQCFVDERELVALNAGTAMQIDPSGILAQGTPLSFSPQPPSGGKPVVKITRMPVETFTLVTVGKRRCPGVTENSSPEIPGAVDALIELASYEYFKQLDEADAARIAREEGERQISQMIDLHRKQTAFAARIVPMEVDANDWREDWQ